MTLRDIVKVLLDRMKIIVLFPVVFVIIAAYFSYTAQTPVYTAQTSLYLLEADASASTTQIAYIEKMTENYRQLAMTSHVMEAAAKAMNVSSLADCTITVTANAAAHMMTVTVTAPNPATAANTANVYSECAIAYISQKMSANNISILEAAVPPSSPSGPSYKRPVLLAGAVGIILGLAVAFVLELSRRTVKTEADITEDYNLPVLAEIPEWKRK